MEEGENSPFAPQSGEGVGGKQESDGRRVHIKLGDGAKRKRWGGAHLHSDLFLIQSH